MTKLLSTDAKRKAMAAMVSDLATRITGHPVTLVRGGEFGRDEYQFRAEKLETDRGQLHHMSIDVCPRGVNIHIQFACPALAPVGANSYSGKWNHYLWHDGDDSAETFRDYITTELRRLLRKVKVVEAVRCDRPGPELWAHHMAQFMPERAEAL